MTTPVPTPATEALLALGRAGWLPPAAATGVGSLPGTSVREATDLVFGESELPYVPELPGRGPGADMVGRTMARLAHVDPAFSITTTPSGWRLTDRPGRDVRRAMSLCGEDLDAIEERASGYATPLKVSLAGPFTLAAAVELVSGEKMLRDAGARRDLGAALGDAAVSLVAELRRRVEHAAVVVQFDEPSLSAVLSGSIRTASGLTALDPVEPMEVDTTLAHLVTRLHEHDVPVVLHSCASVPFDVLRRVGFDGWSFDTSFITEAQYEELGQAVDRGVALLLGAVPTLSATDADSVVRRISRLQYELGFADDAWLSAIGISPACGLGTLSPTNARSIIDTVKSVSRSLRGNSLDLSANASETA